MSLYFYLMTGFFIRWENWIWRMLKIYISWVPIFRGFSSLSRSLFFGRLNALNGGNVNGIINFLSFLRENEWFKKYTRRLHSTLKWQIGTVRVGNLEQMRSWSNWKILMVDFWLIIFNVIILDMYTVKAGNLERLLLYF